MRNALLPVHIISAAGLIGADLTLAVLGFRGLSRAPAVEVYPAMSTVASFVMIPLGALALASGLALARATGVGLRVGWVITKLTITLLLAVVLVGLLAPGIAGVAADVTGAGGLDSPQPQYAVGPVVSATLLTLNVLVALRKPTRLPIRFGRTSKGSTRAAPR